MPQKHLIFLAVVAVAATACAPAPLTLWTDTPEIVTAVEHYNALGDVVELVYVSDVASELRITQEVPDLVIAEYIEHSTTATDFEPLDRIVRRAEDRFYPALLESGRSEGRQHLLPVSFALPIVYYLKDESTFESELTITIEEMQAESTSFDQSVEGIYSRLSYSPVWEPEFLYQFARLSGFTVTEGESSEPVWAFRSLVESVTEARLWVDGHGGPDESRRFADRYLYDPQEQLIRRGRVRYGYADSSSFLSLSDARRDGLAFRWLGTEDNILVLENIVYAGIPADSRNKAAASEFLQTLVTPEFQRAVLESAASKRVRSFGFANGFSSLWEVNERILPEFVPEIEELVPGARSLVFPPPSPRFWGYILDEVVKPWLVRETLGQPQARDLEQSVRAWLLQQEN